MKSVSLLVLILSMLASPMASAFITVIDVEGGPTISKSDDVKIYDLKGRVLTYRGRVDEAALLLINLIEKANMDVLESRVEINPETETISVKLRAADTSSDSVYQWVITRSAPLVTEFHVEAP